jgi:hypothetical protein
MRPRKAIRIRLFAFPVIPLTLGDFDVFNYLFLRLIFRKIALLPQQFFLRRGFLVRGRLWGFRFKSGSSELFGNKLNH